MPVWTRHATEWLLLAVSACGDNVPCELTHGAAVALGTGDAVFEPMPPVLPVSSMLQAIPYLPLRTRIWGIPPGDPTDELRIGNPATMVHADVEAVGWTFDGMATRGYRSAAAGEACSGDDIAAQLRLTVGNAASIISDHEIHFAVTVVGDNGAGASTEMTVTVGSYAIHDAGVDAP